MDSSIQKALNDKLYDKRKGGALELEKLVRECLATNNNARIRDVVDQLCHDYAYAIHQPYARNGGLIGLAAVSIALGPEVARYLEEIVPPVLSCFSDQDARVRYYACESMYNIAKTSKGEILPYFNEIFDALAKLTADTELSVKNGAELLDRLIKDIISDSATSYVSNVNADEEAVIDDEDVEQNSKTTPNLNTAFSLSRFIPLLKERILVISPFTRMFLVSWITLLESVPDLELVTYLPSFLEGLFRFLNDTNQDVVTATQHVLERFLDEVKLIARVKRELSERRKSRSDGDNKSSLRDSKSPEGDQGPSLQSAEEAIDKVSVIDDGSNRSIHSMESQDNVPQDDWTPGQDVSVDHPKILEILVSVLGEAKEEHIQLTALRWIDGFFNICPDDILPFVPELLNQVLPALSSDVPPVRQAGNRVNASLLKYINTLPDEASEGDATQLVQLSGAQQPVTISQQETSEDSKDQHGNKPKPTVQITADGEAGFPNHPVDEKEETVTTLDYASSVKSLTLLFIDESESTRIAALSWLIMLQKKSPRKVLAAHDGTFPALLKTLSDTSETVVARDLQLLCQISRNSDDSYFKFFMINLLALFSSDRRLLDTRGNLIIRQLCTNLSPERIYRTMADCLEKSEDCEFASVMVQNLNNNLITAPELSDLRKKLRNWELKDGQTLFIALFRAWCHNAVATVSLCLLGQAYEQAYNLLQMFADMDVTINMLVQLDKLVQLLESPVFTYLRLQLLEPEKFPSLYKCLYGILMLLPQSAAFAALKNRLNSVSAIGYLHMPSSVRGSQTPTSTVPAFERSNRLKGREDATIKWTELLEKFRQAQDKARRTNRVGTPVDPNAPGSLHIDTSSHQQSGSDKRLLPPSELRRLQSSPGPGAEGSRVAASGATASGKEPGHKSRFSSSNFGRFASGVKGKSKK